MPRQQQTEEEMQFGDTFETQQCRMKVFNCFLMFIFIVMSSDYTAAQGISIDEWNNEAAGNIRLLPKYGYAKKTRKQKEADDEFIAASMKSSSSRREASDKMIAVGFKYLYKDVKTAMYRFNQAYLLDSTNTDIYWGFGGVYMVLGDLERARVQYQYGLKHAPGNPHLLTDYGTYFLLLHYAYLEIDKKKAGQHLDSAIINLFVSLHRKRTTMNIFDFSETFPDEQSCRNHLLNVRLQDGIVCKK